MTSYVNRILIPSSCTKGSSIFAGRGSWFQGTSSKFVWTEIYFKLDNRNITAKWNFILLLLLLLLLLLKLPIKNTIFIFITWLPILRTFCVQNISNHKIKISITKPNIWVPHRERIVYSDIHMKYVNTLRIRNLECLIYKQMVHTMLNTLYEGTILFIWGKAYVQFWYSWTYQVSYTEELRLLLSTCHGSKVLYFFGPNCLITYTVIVSQWTAAAMYFTLWYNGI
jgi:hypothetical protein